jgi:hypothetical protein
VFIITVIFISFALRTYVKNQSTYMSHTTPKHHIAAAFGTANPQKTFHTIVKILSPHEVPQA